MQNGLISLLCAEEPLENSGPLYFWATSGPGREDYSHVAQDVYRPLEKKCIAVTMLNLNAQANVALQKNVDLLDMFKYNL